MLRLRVFDPPRLAPYHLKRGSKALDGGVPVGMMGHDVGHCSLKGSKILVLCAWVETIITLYILYS